MFDDPYHRLLPSFREHDREERYKAVGMVDGKLYVAVHAQRGAAIRLISVRRSNAGEQRDYDRHSGRPQRS
ncbi:MAG TPA: BrnT family toxin [Novosphingobium sp.]